MSICLKTKDNNDGCTSHNSKAKKLEHIYPIMVDMTWVKWAAEKMEGSSLTPLPHVLWHTGSLYFHYMFGWTLHNGNCTKCTISVLGGFSLTLMYSLALSLTCTVKWKEIRTMSKSIKSEIKILIVDINSWIAWLRANAWDMVHLHESERL